MPPHAQFDADGRLVSTHYGDVYFSGQGVGETQHVFLAGNELAQRFEHARGTFVIGETGFGTGLNFLLAADLFVRSAPSDTRLVFVSTEQHVLDGETLTAVHARLPEQLQTRARNLREALADTDPGASPRVVFDDGRIVLRALVGDAVSTIAAHTFAADAWFLDGFSPASNPAMWTSQLLEQVAAHTRPSGTFATYTVAGAVRRCLQSAGFDVDRAPGFGRKREMLRGRLKPRAQASATPPALLPRRVHVLGAGLAGATTARALAERGAHVTVVDPNGIATSSSGIRAAVVRPRLWLANRNDVPDAEIVARAFRWTSHWLTKFAGHHFTSTGVLMTATGPEQAARLRKRAANPATADLASWQDRDEASELAGIDVPHGGAWIPRGGVCDLAELTRNLLEHPAIEVSPTTPAEQADLKVLATAHADGHTAGLSSEPVRGQAMAVSWPDDIRIPRTTLCTSGYLAPPTRGGRTWLGSTYDRGDQDRDQRATDDERILTHFADWPEIAQALARATVVERYAAVRATTHDRLPIVGLALPPKSDARVPTFASLGHGSRGAVTGPWAAELLAALAFGEPLAVSPAHWRRLDPMRFRRQRQPRA